MKTVRRLLLAIGISFPGLLMAQNTFPASGNVGIGTTGPGTSLFVKGGFTPGTMQMAIQSTAADDRSGISFLNSSGSRIASFYASNDAHSYLSGTEISGGVFHIYSAGAERMVFLSNGNVGIGTASPSLKLEVNGAIYSNANDIVWRKATGGVGNQQMDIIGFSSFGLFVHGDGAVAGDSGAVSSFSANRSATTLTIRNAGTGAALTIPNGNVGIGTTNPTHKLSVNGMVRAKEVIVDTGWSDYVFAPDYRLTPLAQVEAHIKAEKHLPGIPSAQEVAEHGISVGEMQAKLLAKIEELTLHVIAQEKVLTAQQKQLAMQQAEISVLKQAGLK